MTYKITVLPGDGIGGEVTPQAVRVLNAVAKGAGLHLEYEEGLVGGCAIDAHGIPLTDSTLRLCQSSQAILFGAVGGPKWDHLEPNKRPERGLLRLRKELDLYANLRPAKVFPVLVDASPLKREVVEGVDILVVRELTGGLYFGEPRGIEDLPGGGRRGYNTMSYTSQEIERVVRTAFQLARGRRKKLTSVDKSNILIVSQLWRQVVMEVAKEFPDVTLDHVLVDSCAMQLIYTPKRFDVIVVENTFGDILSDEAAILTGSIGMLPSASLGVGTALYEPVHGSAPDIAGKGLANPLAAVLSAAMLIRHSLDRPVDADRVEQAVLRVLEKGYRTDDIASPGTTRVGTTQMGDLIVQELETWYR